MNPIQILFSELTQKQFYQQEESFPSYQRVDKYLSHQQTITASSRTEFINPDFDLTLSILAIATTIKRSYNTRIIIHLYNLFYTYDINQSSETDEFNKTIDELITQKIPSRHPARAGTGVHLFITYPEFQQQLLDNKSKSVVPIIEQFIKHLDVDTHKDKYLKLKL